MYDDDELFNKSDDDLGTSSTSNSFNSKDFKDLKGPLREIFGNFIKNHPELAYAAGRPVPRSINTLIQLSKIFEEQALSGVNLSPLRALMDVVDEMTEGEITRRTSFYNTERMMVSLRANFDLINEIYRALTASEHPDTEESTNFIEYLLTYLDILKFSIAEFTQNYRDMAEMYGYPVDEQLIETGVHQFGNLGLASTIGPLPVYDVHHTHGDVSAIQQLRRNDYIKIGKAVAAVVYASPGEGAQLEIERVEV